MVTLDTSHSPIGPCGPLEQSPSGDNFRHVSTALLSCTLDCGTNAGLDCGTNAGLDCGKNAGGGVRVNQLRL